MVRGRRTIGRLGHRRYGRQAGQGRNSAVLQLFGLSVLGCSSVVGDTDIEKVGATLAGSLSSRALNRAMRNEVVAAAASVPRNSETAPTEETGAASGRAAGSEEEGDRSAAVFSYGACSQRGRSALARATSAGSRPSRSTEPKRGEVEDEQRSQCHDEGPERVHRLFLLAPAVAGE